MSSDSRLFATGDRSAALLGELTRRLGVGDTAGDGEARRLGGLDGDSARFIARLSGEMERRFGGDGRLLGDGDARLGVCERLLGDRERRALGRIRGLRLLGDGDRLLGECDLFRSRSRSLRSLSRRSRSISNL